MLNTFVVVWRESLEALLVIGILSAALKKNGAWDLGKIPLYLGVVGGVLLAVTLSLALTLAETELQGKALEYFQTGILFVSAGFILHMVLWMQKHARELSKKTQFLVTSSPEKSAMLGVGMIACFAVGREGMETVLFLYGSWLEAIGNGSLLSLGAGAGLGVAAAIVTSLVLSSGLRRFPMKWFFRISSGFLLLMAGGFVLKGTMRLIDAQVLPPLVPRVWDLSQVLPESSPVVTLLNLVTGYVSAPSLSMILAYLFFWTVYVFLLMSRNSQDRVVATAVE